MEITSDNFPSIYQVMVDYLNNSRMSGANFGFKRFDGKTISCPSFWDEYLLDFDIHLSGILSDEIDDMFADGELYIERMIKSGYEPNLKVHYKAMNFLKEFKEECCE